MLLARPRSDGPQLDLRQRQQERGVLPGAVLVEKFTRAGEVAGLERRLGEDRSRRGLERVDADKLLERIDRFRGSSLFEQVVVQGPEALAGFFLLAHLFERSRGGQTGLEVRGIDGAELDDDFGGAPPIALGAAARGNRIEVRLGIGEETLPGRDVRELNLRRLVERLDLEDLLVERGGLGVEAFVDEVLCDARVLDDGVLRLTGAGVELAKGVGGAPVARIFLDDTDVLGDRRFEATLAEKLLRLFQRGITVDGQGEAPGPARRARDMVSKRSRHPIKEGWRAERPAVHVGVTKA